MDASVLVAGEKARQAQVNGMLDRFFSLANIGTATRSAVPPSSDD